MQSLEDLGLLDPEIEMFLILVATSRILRSWQLLWHLYLLHASASGQGPFSGSMW